MTDLLRILPHFPVGQYASLIPVLEKHGVTTADLLTLDAVDIGKRTHLPLLNIKGLCNALLDALHSDLGVAAPKPEQRHGQYPRQQPARPAVLAPPSTLKQTASSLAARCHTISTLDPTLDRALGGGIATGYVTEITGESGAGKTQFLLTLLLAVQLPPPHGLGKPALYISTEAPLSTRRLAQMLARNPALRSLDASDRPSLDNIISTATGDLESQDHILTFQVPVEIERRNIGLLVLDSVAANFRAEFERTGGQSHSSNMATRGAELVRLGMQLRELARKYNIAVVVANQVADRFDKGDSNFGPKTPVVLPSSGAYRHHQQYSVGNNTQSSPLATRNKGPAPSTPKISAISQAGPSNINPDMMIKPNYPPPPFPGDPTSSDVPTLPALTLDHQQRWFSGWGDDPAANLSLKTPALGLVWCTQLAARIALFKRPTYRSGGRGGYALDDDGDEGGDGTGVLGVRSWSRWMKVVFAPHAKASEDLGEVDGPVEFEITMGGVKAVGEKK